MEEKKYTVTISGREWSFRMGSIFGPMYLYEVVAGKDMPFDPKRLLSLHLMFWCILCKANDDFVDAVPFDRFIGCLNSGRLATALTEMYVEQVEVLTRDADNEPAADSDSKKKA